MHEAVNRINTQVSLAERLLHQEADPGRILACADALQFKIVPLLQALFDTAHQEGTPIDWLQESSATILGLVVTLREAQIKASCR